ncbi:hypothetical protein AX15_007330 [Amanita polypyramis BW_CC]|nr:hypothetical protein AX15_007330 [Amanita polypyramis BW_CC]
MASVAYRPVLVVAGLGTGTGTGASTAHLFAKQGYSIALLARASRADSLNNLAKEINESGGEATAFPLQSYSPDELTAAWGQIRQRYSKPNYSIRAAVFNAGSSVWKNFLDITPAEVESVIQSNIIAAFAFSREAILSFKDNEVQEPIGSRGTLIFTGATASVRGNVITSAFSAMKHAQRALSQSLAKEFGKQNIHVSGSIYCLLILFLKSILYRSPEWEATSNLKLDPDGIASSYLYLVNQSRSNWTWELDLRPAHEKWSTYDFSKHYLAPLRTSPAPQIAPSAVADFIPSTWVARRRRTARERARERREREELDEVDRLVQSISRRRWIYRHHLYAKHVASNGFTRYKPYPSPAQFSASQDLISRTTSFVRRELQVWPNLDVEFLTTFTISIMKSIDVRSESAVKLLAEFLDMDTPYVEGRRHVNAEHFAHEVYSFVRSPYKDLFVYDDVVQYDVPSDVPPPPNARLNRRRWRRSQRTSSESHSSTPSRRSPSPSPPSRPVSPRHPCSKTNYDPCTSSHTRSPSHSSYNDSETNKPHHLRCDNTRASEWKGGQQAPRSYSPHRDGRSTDTTSSGTTSVPCQTIADPEPIASSNRQRSGDVCSDDALLRSGQLSVQRGISLTKPRNTVIDGKGKRRAENTGDETQIDNVQLITTRRQDTSEMRSSSSAQSRAAMHKPPRNRSLRESVEAHLGSGKRMIEVGRDNVNVRRGKPPCKDNNTSSIPSNSDSGLFLFDSLTVTDNASQSNNRNSQNNHSGTTAVIEVKGSTGLDGNTNLSLSARSSHQHSKNHTVQLNISRNNRFSEYSHASQGPLLGSNPDINEPQEIIVSSPERLPQDKDRSTQNVIDTMETPRSTGSAVNNSTIVASIESLGIGGSGLRSRLLSRLREGRDHAYAMSAADSIQVTADKGQITGMESQTHAVDPYAAEERLKKRAHLRMKIAAKKRAMLGSMTS